MSDGASSTANTSNAPGSSTCLAYLVAALHGCCTVWLLYCMVDVLCSDWFTRLGVCNREAELLSIDGNRESRS